MKVMNFLIASIVSVTSFVGFTKENNQPNQMTPQEICEQIEVDMEHFVLDKSGKKLLQVMRERSVMRPRLHPDRTYPSGIVCDWEDNNGSLWGHIEGYLGLNSKWQIDSQGIISVTIEQFSKEEANGDFRESLGKETFQFENFGSINWKSKAHKDINLITRFTPRIRYNGSPIDLNRTFITAVNAVLLDNKGKVWGTGASFSGEYVGIKTHLGSVLLSYYPFESATEIGSAAGKEININLPEHTNLRILSRTSFLPSEVNAKVYGLFIPDVRTEGLGSRHILTRGSGAELLEDFARKK